MATTKLESYDGQFITVKTETARRSVTIRYLMDYIAGSNNDDTIRIEKLNGEMLKLVFIWWEHYLEVIESSPSRTYVKTVWDDSFLFIVGGSPLIDLLSAALHLGIVELVEYANDALQDLIKGKTLEEINVLFGLTG